MRWQAQELAVEQTDALPGLARLNNLVRSVRTPEFEGITFHEVLARSALNHVPGSAPALPFGWTINPYRGCTHACAYCVSGDTLVLTGTGRQRPIRELQVGDEIYGTARAGVYRRYVRTRVLAKWSSVKRAYRIRLADGTSIVASGDHRFLTERGWKHTVGAMQGADRRPYLTTGNSLVGFGTLGLDPTEWDGVDETSYRRGYLAGMNRGDATVGTYSYELPRRTSVVHRYRLAVADHEALDRTEAMLAAEGVTTTRFAFSAASPKRRAVEAIRTSRAADVDRIRQLMQLDGEHEDDWHRGFLAGVFDAEGSCSNGVLRISNSDDEILTAIERALTVFEVPHVREPANAIGVANVRVLGGVTQRQRFFAIVRPAITRKLDIEGRATKSSARLEVIGIDDLGVEQEMFDITTGTADFIANGVVAHNCFARNTHTYLDLDAGDDFDRQIIVKTNVAEVLKKELARPSWQRHPVALGTNTDPYQRAEGRYRLMPGIIEALAESGTPFSILTKGTLLRRDLDLLQQANEQVPVDLAMSIAIYDDELQESIEPGTPSTTARLATVSAIRERGMRCSVFLMPILPHLTDSVAHLDDALRRAKEAGASDVLYTALHLRAGTKEWFLQWLEREHPELVPKYRVIYGPGAYARKDYRRWLSERIRPLLRKHGLERGEEAPVTGGVRSRALARPDEQVRPGAAGAAPREVPDAVAPEATLF